MDRSGPWKLFVASNEKNSITRYDLQTAEKELTVMAPDGGVQGMEMGCASVSPLVVASGKKTFLCDPRGAVRWLALAQCPMTRSDSHETIESQ